MSDIIYELQHTISLYIAVLEQTQLQLLENIVYHASVPYFNEHSFCIHQYFMFVHFVCGNEGIKVYETWMSLITLLFTCLVLIFANVSLRQKTDSQCYKKGYSLEKFLFKISFEKLWEKRPQRREVPAELHLEFPKLHKHSVVFKSFRGFIATVAFQHL